MAGINQKLVTIPAMNSFDEVRQVMAQALAQVQANIANQLPVTNMQGKQLTNVGLPVAADDAVTLKYLQSGLVTIQPQSVVQGSNATSGTGSLGQIYREIPTGTLNGTNTFFTLKYSPSPSYGIWLFLNGVAQNPYSADFALQDNVVTYTVAPKSTDNHWTIYFKGQGGTFFPLFSTGVDATHMTGLGTATDPHWSLTTSPDSTYTGPNLYASSTNTSWAPNYNDAVWISVATNGGGLTMATGTYHMVQKFDLTGFSPSTASINANVAADNEATIVLNGTTVATVGTNALGTATNININTGFVAGTNTLDCQVINLSGGLPNPVGLLFEVVSAVARP